MISIDIQKLNYESLLTIGMTEAPRRIDEVRFSPGAKPVHVATVDDVLFVPDLRLQIVGNRIVPSEAVFDAWDLDFERERNFLGQAQHYAQPFECDCSDLRVCILSNFYSRNFHHWIVDELVKVIIMERSGFTGHYVLVNLPAFTFEFMAMLGVPPERIVGKLDRPTLFKSAVYTTVAKKNVHEHGDVYLALRASLVAAADTGEVRMSPRLWLDRDAGVNSPDRGVVNKDEIYPLLARYGFDVVDMANLPVKAQIAAAANAMVISGPHGAGFAHCLFMKPKSTVIECFSPHFINSGILDICHMMAHRYFAVVPNNAYGVYPYERRLKLDRSHLELILQRLE